MPQTRLCLCWCVGSCQCCSVTIIYTTSLLLTGSHLTSWWLFCTRSCPQLTLPPVLHPLDTPYWFMDWMGGLYREVWQMCDSSFPRPLCSRSDDPARCLASGYLSRFLDYATLHLLVHLSEHYFRFSLFLVEPGEDAWRLYVWFHRREWLQPAGVHAAQWLCKVHANRSAYCTERRLSSWHDAIGATSPAAEEGIN